ncbi:MAG: hypothetical protein LLF94_00960 [Chlamydiales bacterium]|nr:hypothetical protein [Chlamydiales bacterium]
MNILLTLICLLFCSQGHAVKKMDYLSWSKKQVDIVIFSYDRPMQLYAFLESLETYVTHPHLIHVIYRCTDKRFEKGYKEVFDRFSYVETHKQGRHHPERDFKSLVRRSVFSSKSNSPYIMFAADDIIFTDKVNLVECTDALKKYNAWFFSLRLGKNITKNTLASKQSLDPVHVGVPNGRDVGRDMYTWKFTDPTAMGSWNYPNCCDVTIYRKKDLEPMIKKAKYTNPNTFEDDWHWNWQPKNKKGLCFSKSKAVNLPLNVVNQYWQSAHLNISTWQLLEKFLTGFKIDIGKFHNIDNYAPHMPYEPTYIPQRDTPTNGTANFQPTPPIQAPSNPTSQWIQEQLMGLG